MRCVPDSIQCAKCFHCPKIEGGHFTSSTNAILVTWQKWWNDVSALAAMLASAMLASVGKAAVLKAARRHHQHICTIRKEIASLMRGIKGVKISLNMYNQNNW